LGFDVDKDLSLNNNCTNVDVQNTQVFRRQEEQLNKKIWFNTTNIWTKWDRNSIILRKTIGNKQLQFTSNL